MPRKKTGYSLLELFVVMFISAVLTSIAITSWYKVISPTENSSAMVVSYFRKARAKAISSLLAHKITAGTDTQLRTSTAKKCSDVTWTDHPELDFNLGSGTHLSTTVWSVCFDTYGISSSSVEFDIIEAETGKSQTIQITLGGAARRVVSQ